MSFSDRKAILKGVCDDGMEQILSDIDIILHRTGANIEKRPGVVMICHQCGVGIFEEEQYLDFDGEILCRDCVDEMSAKEVFNLFGYHFSRASI